jgi:hypothetical protein
MVSAQCNARFGRGFGRAHPIAILAESAMDFQLPHDLVVSEFDHLSGATITLPLRQCSKYASSARLD